MVDFVWERLKITYKSVPVSHLSPSYFPSSLPKITPIAYYHLTKTTTHINTQLKLPNLQPATPHLTHLYLFVRLEAQETTYLLRDCVDDASAYEVVWYGIYALQHTKAETA